MAEKRYYWLKLQEDFFKSLRIKKLRKLAGGDTFTIIYLKMQLMAIKSEGVLTYKGIEPTFADEIALDMDEDPDNVRLTVAYLLNCGLLETSDDKEFFIPYAVENTGREGSSAQRVREYRERKALQCNTAVTETPLLCYGEKEKEKEKDTERDIKSVGAPAEASPTPEFGPVLQEAFEDWLKYKRERREAYKPTGLKSLATQIKNQAAIHGEEAVASLIRQCMASNWKGIIFDRLQNKTQSYGRSSTGFETSNPFAEMLAEERGRR